MCVLWSMRSAVGSAICESRGFGGREGLGGFGCGLVDGGTKFERGWGGRRGFNVGGCATSGGVWNGRSRAGVEGLEAAWGVEDDAEVASEGRRKGCWALLGVDLMNEK